MRGDRAAHVEGEAEVNLKDEAHLHERLDKLHKVAEAAWPVLECEECNRTGIFVKDNGGWVECECRANLRKAFAELYAMKAATEGTKP